MSKTERCKTCGCELLEDTAAGLCPRCLLALSFASQTIPEGERQAITVSLSPEEMREHFPQFEILECLGRGGMGVVYKARQKALDRRVAIKVLAGERQDDAAFARRFEREAKILAQMSHPNIVTVHDFGEADGLYYIVMEYVDGVNLRDLLADGNMNTKQALAIIPPVCEALQYAHDKGVVHRDIKPENLLLDRDGRVKIADFGIASLVGVEGEKSGTPPYMAPEQKGGIVDQRADIYALGAVLYEMLTGERPGQPIESPSKKILIDVRLDQVVLRAMDKAPERRYQTADEFRTVVETLVTNGEEAETVSRAQAEALIRGRRNTRSSNHPKRSPSPGGASVAEKAATPLRGPALTVAIHGILLVSVVVFTSFIAPRLIQPLQDAGTEPPYAVMKFGLLFLIFSPMVLGVDFAVSYLLQRFSGIWARRAWTLAVALALILPVAGPCIALLAGDGTASTSITFFSRETKFGMTRLEWQINPTGPIHVTSGWYALEEGRLVEYQAMGDSVDPISSPFKLVLEHVKRDGELELAIGYGSGTGVRGTRQAPGHDFRTHWNANPGFLKSGAYTELWRGTCSDRKADGSGEIIRRTYVFVARLLTPDEDPRVTQFERDCKLGQVPGVSPGQQNGITYSWPDLAEEGRLLGGVPTRIDGRDALKIVNTSDAPLQISLIQIDDPAIISMRYALTGEIRYENVEGEGYLEMWNTFPPAQPGGGERRFFTRTLSSPGSGPMGKIADTSDWRPFSLPFDRTGTANPPTRLEFNIFLPGRGTVYIGALTLSQATPMMAQTAPQVLRTAPVAFANDVNPSLDMITVTFDRPMMDKSWSFTAGNQAFNDQTGSIFPERDGEIFYDASRTACTMPVRLQPERVYWVGINSPQFNNFKSTDGTPAKAYQILFATRSADGTPTPLPEELVRRAAQINAAHPGVAGIPPPPKALKAFMEEEPPPQN